MRHYVVYFILWINFVLSAAINVGQFDNPRDFTLRIKDPYAQENTDLMQPVIGEYTIKVLPSYVSDNPNRREYLSHGLYYKQVGNLIYIDVRKPPAQKKAGYYDLSVLLSVPGEGESSNRLKRQIRYVDSATDIILVIDNSLSMQKNDPYGLRYAACENFIHLASLSGKINNIGVIKFSGSAKVVLPLMSPKKAQSLNVGRLLERSRTGNFTNINAALGLSGELFENSDANERIIVLLTDGKNEPDIYRDSHLHLKDLGVKVYTVGLSEQADAALLQQIAFDTHGDYFKAVDDEKLLRIYNQIAQEINDFKPMMDGSESGTLSFPVTRFDEFVDINLYAFNKGTSFELLDPDGKKVSMAHVLGRKTGSTALFRLQAPRVGVYSLKAVGEGTPFFNYNIHTLSHLFLKLFPLEKKYLKGEVIHFAASLAERDNPTLNVPVKAQIYNVEGGHMKTFTLYDDGVHGDNHANDGVYAAVFPMDLDEGSYQIVVVADGKTQDGESFIRTDKHNFVVLEAGKMTKDFFLASVLPLYVDLGEVEQGGIGIANLRLSFEGRYERKISFEGTSSLKNQDSGAVIPWENVNFPVEKLLNPSKASVFTLRFRMPKDAVVGAYSGEIKVVLSDQEIQIPVDFKVKPSVVVRQEILPRVRELAPKEIELVKEDKPERLGEDPLERFLNKDKMDLPLSDEFLSSTPEKFSPEVKAKKIIPSLDIQFSVSPNEKQAFAILQGQMASAIYYVKNESTHRGLVTVDNSGYGDLDIETLDLDAGEVAEVYWSWEAVDLSELEDISIRFKSGSLEKYRALSWGQPPIKTPWMFYSTLAILALLGTYYGILYIYRRESQDYYLSASSWLHFGIVLIAFFYIVPHKIVEQENLDEGLVEIEIIPQEEPKKEEMIVKKVVEQPIVSKPKPEVVEDRPRKMEIVRKDYSLKTEKLPVLDTLPNRDEIVKEIESKVVEKAVVLEDRTSWAVESKTKAEDEPVVMSLNDRPQRRAVLRARAQTKPLERETQFVRRKELPAEQISKMKTMTSAKNSQRMSRKIELFKSSKPRKHMSLNRKLELKKEKQRKSSVVMERDTLKQHEQKVTSSANVREQATKMELSSSNEVLVQRKSVAVNISSTTSPSESPTLRAQVARDKNVRMKGPQGELQMKEHLKQQEVTVVREQIQGIDVVERKEKELVATQLEMTKEKMKLALAKSETQLERTKSQAKELAMTKQVVVRESQRLSTPIESAKTPIWKPNLKENKSESIVKVTREKIEQEKVALGSVELKKEEIRIARAKELELRSTENVQHFQVEKRSPRLDSKPTLDKPQNLQLRSSASRQRKNRDVVRKKRSRLPVRKNIQPLRPTSIELENR